MTNPGGWVAMHRGWFLHESNTGEPFTYREAFHWLIAEAAFDTRTVQATNGNHKVMIELQRGEVCHSLTFMQKAWRWKSVKRVRTFLKYREKWQQIVRKSGRPRGTDQTIITIVNYDVYQRPLKNEGTPEGTAEARQGHELNNYNNSKNSSGRRQEGKKPSSSSDSPDGFLDWYSIYPRKTKKPDALKAFKQTVPAKITLDDLIQRTKQFAAAWATWPKDRQQFIPYPASFLRSEQYNDPPPPMDRAGGSAPIAIPAKIDAPTRDPSSFTVGEWRDRLAQFRETQKWPSAYWGPKPGEPDCRVPASLLTEPRG